MEKIGDKRVIGSEEWCAFPDLGIPAVKARVDSGAKTSSLHAFNITPFKKKGAAWVSFEVHPLQNNRRVVIRCERPVLDKRSVKSSSGTAERRYVIGTSMRTGDEQWDIELTLTNRDSMGYRMLLGREAMNGKLLVDPSSCFCFGDLSDTTLNQFYEDKESVKTGLKIGLLSSNPDLYSNRRILEAGEERGHQMVFLNLEHCYLKLDNEEPEVHYRGGNIVSQLDAVITRIKPSLASHGCAITRQFESMGVYALNSADAIAQSMDKLVTLQMLLKNEVQIPTTGFAKSSLETNDLIEMVGGAPLVVELLDQVNSGGAIYAENKSTAEAVINGFKATKTNVIVQQYTAEKSGMGIRCFVIGAKVVVSTLRHSEVGRLEDTEQQIATKSSIKITAEEKALAVKTAKVLGLKVAAIDIVRTKDGPLVLQVNAIPDLKPIETASRKDVAGLVISSIERKLAWKRELAIDNS